MFFFSHTVDLMYSFVFNALYFMNTEIYFPKETESITSPTKPSSSKFSRCSDCTILPEGLRSLLNKQAPLPSRNSDSLADENLDNLCSTESAIH